MGEKKLKTDRINQVKSTISTYQKINTLKVRRNEN